MPRVGSDGLYRALFERNPQAMWIYDRQALRFLDVNQEAIDRNGYSREEFLAMTITDIRPPEDVPAMLAALSGLGPQTNRSGPHRHRLKDGRLIDVEVWSHAVEDLLGRPARLAIISDITQRLAAERALRGSEARLRAIVDNEPECVKLVAADGRLLEMNAAGLRMVEAEHVDSLRGRPVSELIHPGDRAAFVALHRAVLRGETGQLRFRVVGLRGTERWMETHSVPWRDEGGEVSAVLSVTRDITERKRSEDEAARKARVTAMLETLARTANEARDTREAMLACLRLLTEFGGWALSRVALFGRDVDPPRPEQSVWHADDPARFEHFITETGNVDRARPTGGRFIGTLLRERRAVWIEDFDEPAVSARAALALANGLRSAFAIPVMIGGELVAFLEFFAEWPRRTDPELIAVAESIAGQLARLVERERAQAGNALLAALVRAADDAIIACGEDGVVLSWNAGAERLFGYAAGEIIGRSSVVLFPPEDKFVFDRMYRRIADSERSVRYPAVRCARDGRRIDVLVTAFPVRDASGRITIGIIYRDISELRRAELALRASEERFRYAVAASVDVVWDWDASTDGLWWSSGMREHFGYEPDELEPDASSWTSRLHPEERDAVIAAVDSAIAGTDSIWEHRYRFRRRDGSYALVVDRGYVIRDADGRALRMVGGLTDITRRVAMEEQVRQAQRLDSLGQLTGGVAHDFNNLLTVILGNAELLQERLAGDREGRMLAEWITRAATRGADLTRRLLAFGRRQALTPTPTDVDGLLDGLEDLLRRTLGAPIEIVRARGADMSPALIDAGQLENALLNLAINSRDAMPRGGRITLETAMVCIGGSDDLLAPDLAPGNYVVVSLTDTGEGIPPENMPRLFEPFFTTKEPGRGTGLGLPMVHGFVKQSGGHVSIDSTPGEGTRVRLYLPAWSPPADGGQAVATAAAAAPQGLPAGSGTVLVVEDEDMVRGYALELLRAMGYEVLEASNGAEALALLRARPDIDLLFSDLVMPGGMNGKELALQARALRPGLPVLLTSGYTDNLLAAGDGAEPALPLIGKPYRRADLAHALRRALGGGDTDPR